MLIAPRTPTRALFGAMAAAVLVALYAGCGGSAETERRGGGPLPPLPDATLADVPVPWCAAYQIINCVCQQCHQNPPLHNAPIPLVTYADTQAQFSKGISVAQEMESVLAIRFMPFTGDPTVMPVVQPLTDDQQETMLSWLAQGATNLGGEDCPMTCDWSVGPPPGR
jgi:hypothetical protein